MRSSCILNETMNRLERYSKRSNEDVPKAEQELRVVQYPFVEDMQKTRTLLGSKNKVIAKSAEYVDLYIRQPAIFDNFESHTERAMWRTEHGDKQTIPVNQNRLMTAALSAFDGVRIMLELSEEDYGDLIESIGDYVAMERDHLEKLKETDGSMSEEDMLRRDEFMSYLIEELSKIDSGS